jgi:hypothetical protein
MRAPPDHGDDQGEQLLHGFMLGFFLLPLVYGLYGYVCYYLAPWTDKLK